MSREQSRLTVYFKSVKDLRDEMTLFGEDIVKECVWLIKPKLLKNIEIFSWHNRVTTTNHTICWVPGWLENLLMPFIEPKARAVSVIINHNTGQVKLKGTNRGRGTDISLNACVGLADPLSLQLIGKIIVRCMTGKGDLHVG